ncbi:MAG: hypothetical protein LBB46_03335 [Coriobacteriaceae bacterium]|jgi:hypothetical protein|nr:hypothetical protein [Coriobacteriaceae bacterium]
MSQRNPMNDRYQVDEKKGQTRRSAATAKPKAKAASSVRMQSATKTPKQKKLEEKARRDERNAHDRKYYNPPTEEFKMWKKLYWGLLGLAIITTGGSYLLRMYAVVPEQVSLTVLAFGYVGIIGALIVDFAKVRKLRRAYQEEMASKATKELRAEAKKEHAAAVAAKKAAAAAEDDKAREAASKAGVPGAGKPGRKSTSPFSSLKESAIQVFQGNKKAATTTEAADKAREAANKTDSKAGRRKGRQ